MSFKSTMWLFLCITFYVCITNVASEAGPPGDEPLVASKYGLVRGKQFSVKGTDGKADVFLGIPFAKPPVGPLRLSPPQPPESWDGVRDAASYPPMCLQTLSSAEMMKEIFTLTLPDLKVSEDCLYLNLYTPAGRKGQGRLPVMVWIHGGALFQGAASFYDGSALSVYENVVVVSIQYRLGLLGFFSSGDELARGNWGFLDQVAALQWVQENIASFGGDPDSVTIFGESAGAVSVSALVLSPLAKGLFHRAIAESGSILFPGLFVANNEVVLLIRDMMANATGCEPINSAAIVDCLKKKTEEEILEPAKTMTISIVPANVDGVFITKSPEELMSGKEINPVPFLMGVNNDECGWLFPKALNISNLEEGIEKERITSVMSMTAPLLGSYFEYIDFITDEYLGDTDDPIKLRDLFLEMMSDIIYTIPAIKIARFHRDSDLPVYLYQYQHRPSIFHDLKPAYVKADHADEIPCVLGFPFLDGDITTVANFTDEEKTLSRIMMKYWANFARNGNPNGDGLVEWPAYGPSEQYLQINMQQKTGQQLQEHRMTFWNELLPEKINAINAQKKQHAEL